MTALATERVLLARAKRERAGLRVIWEQARAQIPARRQARFAAQLEQIEPVRIRRNGDGPWVSCEPKFKLRRAECRELVEGMLAEGASRNEILATVGITPATLRNIKQATPLNGSRNPHSHAVESDVSEMPASVLPARMTQAESDRTRPAWHAWVYAGARNPIHRRRLARRSTAE